MSTSDVDLVIKAAEKYGFNLEFKTKNLFQAKGYSTEINKLYQYDGELLELDVQAELNDRLFIVECKGTASNSMLILVKDPDNSESLYSRREIDKHSRIMGFGGTGLFCTFTGDFFTKEQHQLKKLSKNDTENNFYKAQTQVSNALCAVSSTIQNRLNSNNTIHIMPLIVTNAQIWVIDYEQTPTSATLHKWVKHKAIPNTRLLTLLGDNQVFTYLVNIVNINYLKDFLDKSFNMNRSKGTVDNLNDTLN